MKLSNYFASLSNMMEIVLTDCYPLGTLEDIKGSDAVILNYSWAMMVTAPAWSSSSKKALPEKLKSGD